MVGSDVQDHGDPGVKALRGLQLKAGNLEHRPGPGVTLIDRLDDRYSNIAGDHRLQPGGAEDLAAKGGGGGLSVGAGNGQNISLEKARRQFQLADDRQTQVSHLNQFRSKQGHARGNHDQVLPAKGQQSMPPGFHRDPRLEQ